MLVAPVNEASIHNEALIMSMLYAGVEGAKI